MSFSTYPEQSDSGVPWLGELPRHWDVKSLKHVVSSPITDGPHETPDFQDEGVPFVSAEAVAGGVIDFSRIRGHISRADHERFSKKYLPQRDDIYMVKSGATTGVTAIVETDDEFNIWSPLAAIRCSDSFCPRFVLHFLRSRNFLEGVTLNWSFGTQQNIGMRVIENLPCVAPTLNEQRCIAAFLDRETAKIDELVAEQERLISLLKAKRLAVITHAVTKGLDPYAPKKDSGIEWLGETPAHWEVRRLRFVADIETGDADTAHAVEDGEYPFFVRSPNIERIDRYTHDCEAVMTAGDGAGVGKVFHHFTGKFCAHQRVYIFTNFRGVSGKWFYEYLKALFYRVVLEGTAKSTVDSLRRPMIANFPITIPAPDEIATIEAHIAEECRQFDELIAEAEKAVELLKERRAALTSAAVTGKIDVRELVEHHEMEAA